MARDCGNGEDLRGLDPAERVRNVVDRGDGAWAADFGKSLKDIRPGKCALLSPHP